VVRVGHNEKHQRPRGLVKKSSRFARNGVLIIFEGRCAAGGTERFLAILICNLLSKDFAMTFRSHLRFSCRLICCWLSSPQELSLTRDVVSQSSRQFVEGTWILYGGNSTSRVGDFVEQPPTIMKFEGVRRGCFAPVSEGSSRTMRRRSENHDNPSKKLH